VNKVIVPVVVVAVVCAAALAFIAFQPQESGNGEGPLPVVPIAPPVSGTPQMNTTDHWIVIIGEVDQEYPIDYYQAKLMHDGKVLVGPVTIHPMLLGENGNLRFWFHEGSPGGSCGQPEDPCDGKLSQGDYLKLAQITPGETYVVQVLWKATGEVLAEVEVNT